MSYGKALNLILVNLTVEKLFAPYKLKFRLSISAATALPYSFSLYIYNIYKGAEVKLCAGYQSYDFYIEFLHPIVKLYKIGYCLWKIHQLPIPLDIILMAQQTFKLFALYHFCKRRVIT